MPIQLQNNNTLAVTLKGPSSGSFSWVLPGSLGTSGQSLVTDGAGNLSFSTVVANFTGLTLSTSSSTQSTSNIVASGGTTNQGLAISPKGSGGIMMSIPNSASSGGNVRGTYSIDLQTDRTAATQVASGSYSMILGGSQNTNTGSYAVLIGTGNTTSGNTNFTLGKNNSTSGSGIAINDTNGNDIKAGFPFVASTGSSSFHTAAGQNLPTGAGSYSLVYPRPGGFGTASALVAEVCFGIYYTGSTSQMLNQSGSVGATSSGFIQTVAGYTGGTVWNEGAVVAISATGDCKVWYWTFGNYLSSTTSYSPIVLAEDSGATGWTLSANLKGVTATGGSADTIRWYGSNIGQAVNVL